MTPPAGDRPPHRRITDIPGEEASELRERITMVEGELRVVKDRVRNVDEKVDVVLAKQDEMAKLLTTLVVDGAVRTERLTGVQTHVAGLEKDLQAHMDREERLLEALRQSKGTAADGAPAASRLDQETVDLANLARKVKYGAMIVVGLFVILTAVEVIDRHFGLHVEKLWGG